MSKKGGKEIAGTKPQVTTEAVAEATPVKQANLPKWLLGGLSQHGVDTTSLESVKNGLTAIFAKLTEAESVRADLATKNAKVVELERQLVEKMAIANEYAVVNSMLFRRVNVLKERDADSNGMLKVMKRQRDTLEAGGVEAQNLLEDLALHDSNELPKGFGVPVPLSIVDGLDLGPVTPSTKPRGAEFIAVLRGKLRDERAGKVPERGFHPVDILQEIYASRGQKFFGAVMFCTDPSSAAQ